jgi:hypothetical protein
MTQFAVDVQRDERLCPEICEAKTLGAGTLHCILREVGLVNSATYVSIRTSQLLLVEGVASAVPPTVSCGLFPERPGRFFQN